MTVELQALFGATVIFFLTIAVQGSLTPIVQGLPWGLGARDEPRDLTIFQGRIKRTIANNIEAMAMFAPVVLVAHMAGVSTPLTQIGSILFVAARAVYVMVYMLGIPVVRTLIWMVGVSGNVLIGFALARVLF